MDNVTSIKKKLNLLGEREESKYGKATLEEVRKNCESHAKSIDVQINFTQSNIEGEIVTIIQKAKNDGVKIIKGEFIPTKKNSPAETFLPNYGFKKENEYWVYDLNNPIKSPNHLLLEVE